MRGWIKLHRELITKSIWQLSSPEQKVILITILLLANHEENKWEWKGDQFICKPGQFITSLNSLVRECGYGVSIQNVRTALDRFEKFGFLTNVSTKTGRLITIENWEKYQGSDYVSDKDVNKELTKSQQRANKEPTPNKNNKEEKNDKEDKNTYIIQYLNEKAGTKYKSSSKKTQSFIRARLAEGYTVEDFKTVIDKKCADWIGTEFEKYLRPETLFSPKFESYLNANVSNGSGKTNNITKVSTLPYANEPEPVYHWPKAAVDFSADDADEQFERYMQQKEERKWRERMMQDTSQPSD